jgi:DNA gyrase/topoisomerase IV subunit A
MIPYYENYGGIITLGETGFYSEGKLEANGKYITITELPLFVSNMAFSEELDDLVTKKKIREFNNYCNADDHLIRFEVTLPAPISDKDELLELFGLYSTHSMKNMVLMFRGKPKLYATIEEIFTDFIEYREPYYHKRKEYLITKVVESIEKIETNFKIIKIIVDNKLDPKTENIAELICELDSSLDSATVESFVDKVTMKQLRPSGIKALEKQLEALKEEHINLESKDPIEMWISDLDALEAAL